MQTPVFTFIIVKQIVNIVQWTVEELWHRINHLKLYIIICRARLKSNFKSWDSIYNILVLALWIDLFFCNSFYILAQLWGTSCCFIIIGAKIYSNKIVPQFKIALCLLAVRCQTNNLTNILPVSVSAIMPTDDENKYKCFLNSKYKYNFWFFKCIHDETI